MVKMGSTAPHTKFLTLPWSPDVLLFGCHCSCAFLLCIRCVCSVAVSPPFPCVSSVFLLWRVFLLWPVLFCGSSLAGFALCFFCVSSVACFSCGVCFFCGVYCSVTCGLSQLPAASR